MSTAIPFDDDKPSTGRTWLLLLTILAMLAAGGFWAHWAKIDEVSTGLGRLVPTQQTQVIQSLEGGIVRELAVREGDRVSVDQMLMRIDDTGFSARLGEVSKRRIALEAEIVRLTAESEGLATLDFPEALKREAPDVVAAESALFASRRQRLANELQQLDQQKTQRQQELAELDARRRRALATIAPVRTELQLNRGLLARGNVAQVEVLRLERQLADHEGELAIVNAAIPRARAAIAEVETRAKAAENIARVQAGERLQASRSELSINEETMKGASDRVVRTAVKSPVRGTINRLAVTTIGAVVGPGQTLAEITPLDDAMLFEARIRPKDIPFIRLGQSASIKLSAYDFMVYGALKARVVRIGSDSLKDERGEPFYQVMLEADRATATAPGKQLTLIPGLVGTVDISTGEKTVLDYLIKPFQKARAEALRER
ncbi:MAG: hypothetical protein RL291_1169 [Pseudomonadota bacterium]